MVAIPRIIATIALALVAASLPTTTASPMFPNVMVPDVTTMSNMRTSNNMLSNNRAYMASKKVMQRLKQTPMMQKVQSVKNVKNKLNPTKWSRFNKKQNNQVVPPVSAANSQQLNTVVSPIESKRPDSVQSTASTTSAGTQQPAGLKKQDSVQSTVSSVSTSPQRPQMIYNPSTKRFEPVNDSNMRASLVSPQLTKQPMMEDPAVNDITVPNGMTK